MDRLAAEATERLFLGRGSDAAAGLAAMEAARRRRNFPGACIGSAKRMGCIEVRDGCRHCEAQSRRPARSAANRALQRSRPILPLARTPGRIWHATFQWFQARFLPIPASSRLSARCGRSMNACTGPVACDFFHESFARGAPTRHHGDVGRRLITPIRRTKTVFSCRDRGCRAGSGGPEPRVSGQDGPFCRASWISGTNKQTGAGVATRHG